MSSSVEPQILRPRKFGLGRLGFYDGIGPHGDSAILGSGKLAPPVPPACNYKSVMTDDEIELCNRGARKRLAVDA